jgi:AraC-like DNA-binding protein
MSLFDTFSYKSKRSLGVAGTTGMGAAVAELVRDANAEVGAMDLAEVARQPDLSASGFPAIAGEAGRPAVPEVSGVLLRALADVVIQAGIAPDTLFQREERRFATCEPTDVRVPLPAYRALLARAIALTGDPAIGLRCALHASEAAFDLMAPLVAHVLTLRHAIQEASQFQSLVFNGAHLLLTERAGVARVRCEFPRSHDPTDRSLAEFLTAGLMRMLRGFRCSQSEFYAARFEHERPAYHHAYAEAFEGKERFSQEYTGVEFAADLLDRRHLHANPALQALVHTQAEQRLGRLSRPAVIDRLRMYLLSEPSSRVPGMAVAARRLGVSVRTLRRRLAETGQSYRALTQEIQGERACMLLRNPDFTLQTVAGALGYAHTAAFYRAFKRWTGRTACDYRNGHS